MTREEYNAKCKILNTKRREARKAAGLCYQCGAMLPEGWKQGTRCPDCIQSIHDYNHSRYADRKSRGACVYCGKPAQLKRVVCKKCALERSEYNRKRKEMGLAK